VFDWLKPKSACDSCRPIGAKFPFSHFRRNVNVRARYRSLNQPLTLPEFVGRSRSFAPIILKIAGRTNCKNVTNAETGFPGKPKMRHLPNCPNKNGLPGFDCDPPDVDLRPEIAQSFLNEIVFAHRNAAAHDQNLILRGALHSSPQRITIIAATFGRSDGRAQALLFSIVVIAKSGRGLILSRKIRLAIARSK